MKLGHTSAIHFASKVLASLFGFAATIYFARRLGAETLGIYYVVLMLVSWFQLANSVGVSSALQKRLSEREDLNQYFTAGLLLSAATFLLLGVIVLVFSDQVNGYVGRDVALLVVGLVFLSTFSSIADSTLIGRHYVHISGLLTPVRYAGRSLVQVLLVVTGFGLTGLLVGYGVGWLLTGIVAFLVVSVGLGRPHRHHFERLFEFAKYSWAGRVQGQVFNWTDLAVLGFLASSSLIGIYSIAWNVALFLAIFGDSLSATLFPEISRVAAEDDAEKVSELTNESLAFAGLFLFPGTVGAATLGDRILRIYGSQFVEGHLVLTILVGALLVYGYQDQLISVLNAVDHPHLAFRANVVFVSTNLLLNVVLVWMFGWVGAAVATFCSAVVGCAVTYGYLQRHVEVLVPIRQIGYQAVAAFLMGFAVWAFRVLVERHDLTQQNYLAVGTLVPLGAFVYFTVLFGISNRFRETVVRNLPSV
jgi:O-antigen/teichoic acid export membrane protein